MAEAWIWGVATLVVLMVWRRVLRAVLLRGAGASNAAGRILEAAETLGVILIAAAQTRALAELDAGPRALWTFVFGGVAVGAVVVSGGLVSRVFMQSNVGRAVKDGNVAAATAAGGHVVAAALVASDCLLGSSLGDLGISLGAFLGASVALHGLVALFRTLTTYDDAAEIRDGNVAAGLSHAGVCIALGLVVGNAVHGTWAGFGASAAAFGAAILWALALYPVRQFLVETLILGAAPRFRGGKVDDGVGRGRDVGLAALEAASFLGVAILARSLA